MEIKIYQNYYLEEQKQYLDPAFVPHDNLENKQPELHEYPILKKLQKENESISDEDLWGLVSWRWTEKTRTSGSKFINWIQSTPGYDLYHLNYDLHSPRRENNIIIHGEKNHAGLLSYFQRLSQLMKWDLDLKSKYDRKYFITCHYYVMNNNRWNEWITFLDNCLEVSYNDELLNHYIKHTTSKRYGKNVPNFCFVVERLICIHCILRNLNVIEYHESNKHIPSRLRK